MTYHFANKTAAELRAALANAEALVPTTWDGREAKRERIAALRKELNERKAS